MLSVIRQEMYIQEDGEIQENYLNKTQSNKQGLKPKVWCCLALVFLEWVIPQTQDMDMHFLVPCCIMHCQEMSQPVQNNPYGFSPVSLLSLLFTSTSLSVFCLSVFKDGCENNGTKQQEGRRWRELEKVRVSSYSEGIEHRTWCAFCSLRSCPLCS